jgi:hypothetical protein
VGVRSRADVAGAYRCVLEVLNAQAALVRAQQVDASRRWLLARLDLAYAVGDLGTSPGLFGARALDAPQLGAR